MHKTLPALSYEALKPTRGYLQDVAKVLGKLQQVFLPPEPHDWQRGLRVGMRGAMTHSFRVDGKETHASLDLVAHKVRLDGSKWSLAEYSPEEILKNVKVWLSSHDISNKLEEPQFSTGTSRFDSEQAEAYAVALWWMHERLHQLKTNLKTGMTSPILLYPHHFDLSLTWFVRKDERQLTVGFSTGDETIAEPYLYITAYPEPAGFTQFALPKSAYWQTKGFSGAVLPYDALQTSSQPEKLFQAFATVTLKAAAKLFT